MIEGEGNSQCSIGYNPVTWDQKAPWTFDLHPTYPYYATLCDNCESTSVYFRALLTLSNTTFNSHFKALKRSSLFRDLAFQSSWWFSVGQSGHLRAIVLWWRAWIFAECSEGAPIGWNGLFDISSLAHQKSFWGSKPNRYGATRWKSDWIYWRITIKFDLYSVTDGVSNGT